jgi:hypothetical protein
LIGALPGYHQTSVFPVSERPYLSPVSSTNPAFLSSRRPLLTRNNGWPVLLVISSGDNVPFFKALNTAIPVDVGFPSGDTQGIKSALWEFLHAEVPVFALVTFFKPLFCLLSCCRRRNHDWIPRIPVGRCGHLVFVSRLQGIYQP